MRGRQGWYKTVIAIKTSWFGEEEGRSREVVGWFVGFCGCDGEILWYNTCHVNYEYCLIRICI